MKHNLDDIRASRYESSQETEPAEDIDIEKEDETAREEIYDWIIAERKRQTGGYFERHKG